VRGTILCGVTDSAQGRGAAQAAVAVSERLGLRLVLAHVVEEPAIAGANRNVDVTEGRREAARVLEQIARDLALDSEVECREAFGDRAERLAQIAAEEGADMIVLGSRPHGFRGRHLRCTLARELESTTPCPVLVAPLQTRKRSERRLAVAEMLIAR
jgi:nucleotide-binding universal stress UspA family protein